MSLFLPARLLVRDSDVPSSSELSLSIPLVVTSASCHACSVLCT